MPIPAYMVDDVLREAEEELNQMVCEVTRRVAEDHLRRGVSADDLPNALAPFTRRAMALRDEGLIRLAMIARRHGGTVQ
jgi:hypothetical protein